MTCPAGQTRPLSAGPGRPPSERCAATARCAARCTTSKTGRKLVLHEHDDLLRAARADWAADPDLREDYRQHRPNVERAVSQVATRGGRRLKLRYRGTVKNNAWLKRRTAALNLRNLIGRGLTRIERHLGPGHLTTQAAARLGAPSTNTRDAHADRSRPNRPQPRDPPGPAEPGGRAACQTQEPANSARS